MLLNLIPKLNFTHFFYIIKWLILALLMLISCIIAFHLNCIMQLKQFYDIASKVSCRKKCFYFWWSTISWTHELHWPNYVRRWTIPSLYTEKLYCGIPIHNSVKKREGRVSEKKDGLRMFYSYTSLHYAVPTRCNNFHNADLGFFFIFQCHVVFHSFYGRYIFYCYQWGRKYCLTTTGIYVELDCHIDKIKDMSIIISVSQNWTMMPDVFWVNFSTWSHMILL